MDTSDTLFVGIKRHVAAFSKRDGKKIWQAELGDGLAVAGIGLVTLLAEDERVYAHAYGKLFCLDARTGKQLWTNDLAGLGYGIAMLSVVGQSSPAMAAHAEQIRKSVARSAS